MSVQELESGGGADSGPGDGAGGGPGGGPGSGAAPRPEVPHNDDADERRRLSVFDLVGLAAGGVIGSGWLFAADHAYCTAGSKAVWSWAVGGVLMLVIAVVMVELGTALPKTGGLIFLPLQSSGPQLAIVVAAGLWIFYAINAASEAAAITNGLTHWFGSLSDIPERIPKDSGPADFSQYALSGYGLICATVLMLVIVAVNLLAQQLLVKVNFLLTLWKIFIPVLVVALLIASGFGHHREGAPYSMPEGCLQGDGHGLGPVMAAVVGSGVIYAYVGFQAPLDFAGDVRRRGIGETARIRWAVYGTVVGSIILYILLQIVFNGDHTDFNPGEFDSPYTQFATAAFLQGSAPFLLQGIAHSLRINALLSPMGSGLVFTHALTREVAALGRAHLTHRGLQTGRNATIKVADHWYEVYWLVLLVDFVIGWIALMSFGQSWASLAAISGVLTLVIYAMPGMVLVAMRAHLPEPFQRRRVVHSVLAQVSFVAIALILYWADWTPLWKGMAALFAGAVLLLWLPVLARWDIPVLRRFLSLYDAVEHTSELRKIRTPSVASAALLTGYLGVLTALSLMAEHHTLKGDTKPVHGILPEPWGSLAVGALALPVFHGLVALSRKHMERKPPELPARAGQPPLNHR